MHYSEIEIVIESQIKTGKSVPHVKGRAQFLLINLLKPTGHVMHQQV